MLEKIFTSKNRVKILRFLFFEKNESYLREISRELNISISAVKREVENLNFTNIIKMSGNRIMINKNCNFIEDLKNIFIKTDFIIYPIKDSLKSKEIKYALIFGSFARGNYTSESDIDLMIIGKIKSLEIYKKIKPVEKNLGREINSVVWTVENLKKQKNSGFVRDVLKKGFVMIKGDKDEFQKIIR